MFTCGCVSELFGWCEFPASLRDDYSLCRHAEPLLFGGGGRPLESMRDCYPAFVSTQSSRHHPAAHLEAYTSSGDQPANFRDCHTPLEGAPSLRTRGSCGGHYLMRSRNPPTRFLGGSMCRHAVASQEALWACLSRALVCDFKGASQPLNSGGWNTIRHASPEFVFVCGYRM